MTTLAVVVAVVLLLAVRRLPETPNERILGVAVLAGGLVAGGVTAGTIRTDAGNPVLLRLLGLIDVLLLGLPTIAQIALGDPLSWTGVVIQGTVAVVGARAYLTATTRAGRVELSGR